MKNYYLLFLTLFFAKNSFAQIAGSSTVCASYIYTYSISTTAVNYTWTLPNGWNILSGQGTSSVSVFCNINIGNVCVLATDSAGDTLSQNCLPVSWGGGSGWDVTDVHPGPCVCDPAGVMVSPNSTGCPGSCGNGVQSPNTFFAIYDNSWPTGNYMGPANGTGVIPVPMIMGTYVYYYVYLIDTTFGLNNAVLISGSSCSPTINNIIAIYGCSNILYGVTSSPDTACVGDTITFDVYQPGGPASWWSDPEITILPYASGSTTVQGILNTYVNHPIQITALVNTFPNNCQYIGHGYVIPENCNILPTTIFHANDTAICPSSCVNFINQSILADSYQWLFPGANTSTDTSQNPHNICYSNPGSYDVTLITSNQVGTDTLTLNNYITVYNVTFSPIIFDGDTLFADSNFVSYQWYLGATLIQGATDSYYIPQTGGNYSVHVIDSNGCEATALLQGVSVSVPFTNENDKVNIFYAANIVHIENSNSSNSKIKIEVFDLFGRNLFEQQFSKDPGTKYIDIPLDLPQGFYFVSVNTGRTNHLSRIYIH